MTAGSITSTSTESPLALPAQRRFLKASVWAASGATGLFLLSLLLPAELSTVAQDLMCWLLVAASAATLLGLIVKVIDGFLDL